MRNLYILATLLSVFATEASWAGRRAHSFTFDTEILAQGDFEWEQWLWAKLGQKPNGSALGSATGKPHVGWLWFGPVYGLSRRVELSFPWEIVADTNTAGLTGAMNATTATAAAATFGRGTRIADFAAETRILLTDPADTDGQFRALIRTLLQFNIDHPSNGGPTRFDRKWVPWIGADAVLSYGDIKGTHATVDFGYFQDARLRDVQFKLVTIGVAGTYKLLDELRVGAEMYMELPQGSIEGAFPSAANPLTPANPTRINIGPTVAFSKGATWMTLGVLLGANSNSHDVLPRLLVGAAL